GGTRQAPAAGRHAEPAAPHPDAACERRMPAHDRARVVEDHLRALVVEGRADDVLRGLAAEEPPEPHNRPAVALAVAARHRDAREAVQEASLLASAGRCERLPLPRIELHAEALREREDVVEERGGEG